MKPFTAAFFSSGITIPSSANPLFALTSTRINVSITGQAAVDSKTMSKEATTHDTYWLWDLKIETLAGDAPMVCNHPEGSGFTVEGENIIMGAGGHFPLYSLAALLPMLPARQRPTDAHDWMTTDTEIACPDPHCGARFRITRIAKREFKHAETTGLPDKRTTPYWQNKD